MKTFTYFGIAESRHLWLILAAYIGTAWIPLVMVLPFLPDPTDVMERLDKWARDGWAWLSARLPFRRPA